MTRVYVYCEGQTEESFVKNVLRPYLSDIAGLYLEPIICETKNTPTRKFKGGLLNYSKAKREIHRLCASHPNEYITTMLDFYAFPKDAPGMSGIDKIKDVYRRIEHVEAEMDKDIGCKNFIPNLMLHEFEALLFVKPELLSKHYQGDTKAMERLKSVREAFQTPEHIDRGKETAPSKRIQSSIPEYDKILSGTAITAEIGIDALREECRHFSSWIDRLCSL